MSRKRKADAGLAPSSSKRPGNDVKAVPSTLAQSAFAAARSDPKPLPVAAILQPDIETTASSRQPAHSSRENTVTTTSSVSVTKSSTNIRRQYGSGINLSDVLSHINIAEPRNGGFHADDLDHLNDDDTSDSESSTQSDQAVASNGIPSESLKPSWEGYPKTWRQARESLVHAILADSDPGKSMASKRNPRVIVQVIGSASASITTFAKFLIDSILAPPEELGYEACEAVAVLDLNSSVAEFSLPGHIELGIITRPDSIPEVSQNSSVQKWARKTIHSHAVGLYAHHDTPELFLVATEQLLDRVYDWGRSRLQVLPLVICCPSLERESEVGMGGRITSRLTALVNAGHLCCLAKKNMQQSSSITAVRNALQSEATFWELETHTQSHAEAPYSLESSRDLSLQTYFHLHSDSLPLSYRRPLKVRYDPQTSDIAGVFVLGDVPPMYPYMLSKILNGSIVAIVVLQSSYLDDEHNAEVAHGIGDGIPHFELGNCSVPEFLGTSQSSSIGLGLIRSMDTEKKELYILTPNDVSSQLSNVDTDRIVLVHGVADSPGWAYRNCKSAAEGYEFVGQYRDMKSLYLGGAKKGMQVVKTRRFKKKS